MDANAISAAIKNLRIKQGMTQEQLGQMLGVSSKAVSKWETAKGLPDISLFEPIAKALGISVSELMSGEQTENKNVCANLLRSKFYVCPICSNVIHSTGAAAINCCGKQLVPLIAHDEDDSHAVTITEVEDEYYLSVEHPMSKEHYVSFIAYVTADGFNLVKLYPEGSCEARMRLRMSGDIYFYCTSHGLFKARFQRPRPQRKSPILI